MLIVYRAATGEVVHNSGTNSALPRGPEGDAAYTQTDLAGIPRAELGLLRLHDVEQADLVRQVLTHRYRVEDGNIVLIERHPKPRSGEVVPPLTTAEIVRVRALLSKQG